MSIRKFAVIAPSLGLASALVLGVSMAAHALTATSSVTTFDSATEAPAFSSSLTLLNAGMTATQTVDNDIQPSSLTIYTDSSDKWTINTTNFPNCTTAYTTANVAPPSVCGITLGADSINNVVRVYVPNTTSIQLNFQTGSTVNNNWAFGTKNFEFGFASGLWNTKTAGIVPFKMQLSGGYFDNARNNGAGGWWGPLPIDTRSLGTVNLTVNSTITFDGNGSTDSMSPQSAYNTRAITANTLTKSGYTFAGWATSQANANAGTVAYTDAASYNFVTGGTRTLYAVWATQPAAATTTAAGTTTSSSDNLASTGSNNSQLFGYAGALALTLMILGGVMVAARRIAKK